MGATCLDQLMAGLPEGSELTSGIPPPLYATHKELPQRVERNTTRQALYVY